MIGERLNGRCACGAVTFTATPRHGAHACHCETCRRVSGGVMIAVDCGDSVEVQGPLATYESSDWAVRQFCPSCGANLFWKARSNPTTIVSIQAFDDPAALPLETEFCIDLKPEGYAFAGDHPRLTEAELMALFADEA